MFAIIVHFNIQKLKNKHAFIQTEKAKSSHFDRTRGDKNQIFPTLEFVYLAGDDTYHDKIEVFSKWLNVKNVKFNFLTLTIRIRAGH